MKHLANTYVRLVGASVGAAIVVGSLGYYPTRRIGGSGAVEAMLAGIAISFVAGCIGAIPIGLAGSQDPRKAPSAILMATAVRFLAVIAVTVSVMLSGWFDRKTLGLWVGIAYLAMLAVDTIYAVHMIGRRRGHQA